MSLPEEPEVAGSDEYLGDPYVIKTVSPKLKVIKTVAAWCVPLLLAIAFSLASTPNDSLAQLTWLPLLATGLAVWYSRKLWLAEPERVLETVRHRIRPLNPLKKVVYSTLLTF